MTGGGAVPNLVPLPAHLEVRGKLKRARDDAQHAQRAKARLLELSAFLIREMQADPRIATASIAMGLGNPIDLQKVGALSDVQFGEYLSTFKRAFGRRNLEKECEKC